MTVHLLILALLGAAAPRGTPALAASGCWSGKGGKPVERPGPRSDHLEADPVMTAVSVVLLQDTLTGSDPDPLWHVDDVVVALRKVQVNGCETEHRVDDVLGRHRPLGFVRGPRAQAEQGQHRC